MKSFFSNFFQKGSATPTAKGPGSDETDWHPEKVYFFGKLSQSIIKKLAAGGKN